MAGVTGVGWRLGLSKNPPLDKNHDYILIFRNMSNYKSIVNLSNIFKALGNPARLVIFLRLAGCCRPGMANTDRAHTRIGVLGSTLGLAPSTVSHHVKELRRAGLLHMTRAGKNVECRVDPGTLDMLSEFFKGAGYD